MKQGLVPEIDSGYKTVCTRRLSKAESTSAGCLSLPESFVLLPGQGIE